jgi:hypothetical protein
MGGGHGLYPESLDGAMREINLPDACKREEGPKCATTLDNYCSSNDESIHTFSDLFPSFSI